MPNMSYCRFENTTGDLRDCIDDLGELTQDKVNRMSQHERPAVLELISLCQEVVERFDEYGDAYEFNPTQEMIKKSHEKEGY